MLSKRLSLALDLGLTALPPDGSIGVFSDGEIEVPSGLAPERVRVISPWRPTVERWRARGFAAGPVGDGPFTASVVVAGRSRAANRLAIGAAAAATQSGGTVLVDGQKTDGIDTLLRDIRKRAAISDSFAKHHGKLFWFVPAPGVFADWARLGDSWPLSDGFHTAPGAFSADGPDPASAALAAALPAELPPSVADLGAGWGYLSAAVLARSGVERVDLVEAHHGALSAARRNLADPRARFHWADVTTWQPERPGDAVVTNPPFHTGRTGDPSLGEAFIAAAARSLSPAGTLWLVANRHLPYEAAIEAQFARAEALPAPSGFKIIAASAPRRPAHVSPRCHAKEPL